MQPDEYSLQSAIFCARSHSVLMGCEYISSCLPYTEHSRQPSQAEQQASTELVSQCRYCSAGRQNGHNSLLSFGVPVLVVAKLDAGERAAEMCAKR